jgi:hypothetical protein
LLDRETLRYKSRVLEASKVNRAALRYWKILICDGKLPVESKKSKAGARRSDWEWDGFAPHFWHCLPCER